MRGAGRRGRLWPHVEAHHQQEAAETEGVLLTILYMHRF